MSFFDDLEVIHEELEREKYSHASRNFKDSTGSKSSPSGSDTANANHGNSTSDDDVQVLDNRKQRRMLSNRESARRSRLRKQQHLDELRSHVAQLRVQNSQMLTSFSVTSKHFAQVAEENRILRLEAANLNQRLQNLHHAMLSHQYSGGFTDDASQSFEAPRLAQFRSYSD